MVLVSCSDDDTEDADLIGNWKLIEILVDPGDGNGTFQDVDSEKMITFLGEDTFTSNGNICEMTGSIENPSEGFYSETDSTITPVGCSDLTVILNFNYEINGNTLKIYYPCIEPCIAKYTKQ